jgi:hypothetical protein
MGTDGFSRRSNNKKTDGFSRRITKKKEAAQISETASSLIEVNW